jgi:acetoacetyl-CoA reductase
MRILLLGASGFIGRELFAALAARGHRVVACDLSTPPDRHGADATATADGRIQYAACDIADHAQCEALVARIEATLGPVAVLVNNAGIARDSTLRKMTREQWDAVRAVDYDGVFNLTRPVIGGMCDRGFGRVVSIASIVGQTGAFGQANYAAAKAGVHGFTMALAREVAGKGVTVNSVSPGYVRSAMTDAIPDEVRARIVGAIPMGRIGEPDDIARAVAFLCSDEAAYITGVNLPVNGGLFIS